MSLDLRKEYKDYKEFFVNSQQGVELNEDAQKVSLSDYEHRTLELLKSHQGQIDGLTLKEYYYQNFGDRLPVEKEHFFVEALKKSWWSSVLPSKYSIYLWNVDEEGQSKEILIRVFKGKVDAFFAPDWTGVSKESMQLLSERVEILNRKYDQKFLGFKISTENWSSWSHQHRPWKAVLKSIQRSETQMYPARMSVLSLIGLRGVFGI